MPPKEVFVNILGRPPNALEVASLALAPTTSTTLSKLEVILRQTAVELNLHYLHPVVAMNHISGLLAKGWKFSSCLTTARNIIMLASRRESLPLLHCPNFQDLRRGLCRLAALESPKQAPAISFSDLSALVARLVAKKDWEMAAFMALAWLLAGRLGEVAAIPTAHFLPLERPMRVKFSVMKGVYGSQEKCLPDGQLALVVCEWHSQVMSRSPPSRRLFTKEPAQAIACLRKEVNPGLSGHSIRRGALSHGDQKGASSQDLMTLSSHKSLHILQRYIGIASSDRREAMLRAGVSLTTL